MKITKFKNEDAIDLLADILEPATEIFTDQEMIEAVKTGKKYMAAAKIALKNHKSAVLEILARMDGKEPEEYSCTPVSIMTGLVELMSDKELVDFFTSQAQELMNQSSSIFAAANTEETETE